MTNRDKITNRLPAVALTLVWILLSWGCASVPIPPSETTVTALRTFHERLAKQVAAGELSPTQAQDQYYARLSEVDPPLPGLEALLESRREVGAHVASGQVSAQQAHAQLSARESETLARWDEMAAQYAAEQRRLERLQSQHEQGFRFQQMPVAGRPSCAPGAGC
jgi:hypothetical protein